MTSPGPTGGGPAEGGPAHPNAIPAVPPQGFPPSVDPFAPPAYGPAQPPPAGPAQPPPYGPGQPFPPYDPGPLPAFGAPLPPPPKRRRGLLIGVIAVGVVVVLGLAAAAVAVVANVSKGSTGHRSTAGGTSASPSPSPTPVSATAYQQELDNLDTLMTTALQTVRSATSPAALNTAAATLEFQINYEIQKLEALTAPAQIEVAHRRLKAALESLKADIGYLTGSVCAGSSAIARISQAAGAEALRGAAQELATADPTHPYKVGSFLPPKTPDAHRRLGNGSMIKKIGARGLGQFKIKNSGASDSVVTLSPVGSSSATFVVYVQGNANYTVTGVKDGNYYVYLSTGSDWDPGAHVFTLDCHTEKFDDTFTFKTTGRTYTVWTVTLHATDGNAQTTPLDPGAIPV